MIKRLAKCVGEYKIAAFITPISVGLESLVQVLIPTIVAMLIDEGITPGSMPDIFRVGIYLVICCVASLIFGAVSGAYCAKAGAGFAKNLRREMFYRVQDYSFANIDKFSPSSIVTRMTTDVTNVQNSFQMIIRIAVRAPAVFIFSLIMSFRMNMKISIVFLLLFHCSEEVCIL